MLQTRDAPAHFDTVPLSKPLDGTDRDCARSLAGECEHVVPVAECIQCFARQHQRLLLNVDDAAPVRTPAVSRSADVYEKAGRDVAAFRSHAFVQPVVGGAASASVGPGRNERVEVEVVSIELPHEPNPPRT